MSIPGAVATALAAVLLLSSCVPSSTPPHTTTAAPSPTASEPAFLGSEQVSADQLADGVADRVGVDATSSRRQGDFDGHEVFLAVRGTDSVCLVTGVAGQLMTWNAGCGHGNEVVTFQFPDGGLVKYLPMTTSTTPVGWTRLSDFVFAM